jgi:hypothetical protein
MLSNVLPLKKLDIANPYQDLRYAYQSEIEKVDEFIKENYPAMSSLSEKWQPIYLSQAVKD